MLTIPLATLLGWLFKKYLGLVKASIQRLNVHLIHLLALVAIIYSYILLTREFYFGSSISTEFIHLGSIFMCILGFGLMFMKNSLSDNDGFVWFEKFSIIFLFIASCIIIFLNIYHYTEGIKKIIGLFPSIYRTLRFVDAYGWIEILFTFYLTSFILCVVIFITDTTDEKR